MNGIFLFLLCFSFSANKKELNEPMEQTKNYKKKYDKYVSFSNPEK